jgi:hypothetical protein
MHLCVAYIDPGSGILLWQSITAGFVGVLFYFRKKLAGSRKRQ